MNTRDAHDATYNVVKGDRVDSVEEGKVVLERGIVSVPCNNIEGRVVLLGGKETATILVDDTERLFLVSESCNRGLEVTSVCKAVCANGAEIRERPGAVEDFANVTTANQTKTLCRRDRVSGYELCFPSPCSCILLPRSFCCDSLPWSVRKSNRETNATLNDTDFVGVNQELSKLGVDVQATLLRNYG